MGHLHIRRRQFAPIRPPGCGCRTLQQNHTPCPCMPTALDRPPRHGRVLRVGRAAALSRAARPAGRDRRRPAPPAASARRRHARVRPLRDYAGRGVITTATYEARALGVHSGMGLMKAALLAPDAVLLPVDFDEYRNYSRLLQGRGARDRAADRRPRHRRDLHRPDRRARRARRGRPRSVGGVRAIAPRSRTAVRARHRPHLLDRHHAEQAALQDRLRARQARRPDAADARRHADADLAAAGAQASTASARRPARSSRALGIHTHRRPRAARSGIGCSSISAAATARWLHEASHGRDERAGGHRRASRSRSAAKPRSSATCTRCATAPSCARSSPSCASSWPATCSARATPARRSASSCASTTSRS